MSDGKVKMVKCAHCDELHPVTAMVPTFRLPDDIVKAAKNSAPMRELDELAKEDITCYSANRNMAVLQEKGNPRQRCFIRCIIPLPLIGTDDTYDVGCWAEMFAFEDFYAVASIWNDDAACEALPELTVWLANDIPTTNMSTMMIPASLKTHATSVPTLKISRHSGCDLAMEQETGIGLERLQKFASIFDNDPSATDVHVH